MASRSLQPQQAGSNEPANSPTGYKAFHMSDEEFSTIRQWIYEAVGIEIKPHKKHLVINRLSKRLRHLGLTSFAHYLSYIQTEDRSKKEFTEMVDVITTNKTDFFREAKQFDFLRDKVIPQLRAERAASPIKVWSAACSSGEEPYSLAIWLSEIRESDPGFRFDILASDISETILRNAVEGIYQEDKIRPIEYALLKKYFLKGNGRYKIKPQLSQLVTFKKINLKHGFQSQLQPMHVIFLRNVMIYFNQQTQEEIVRKCWDVLTPGGYLFLGLSETLHNRGLPFEYAAPSIYKKIG